MRDTNYTQAYYPLPVAADMCGYSVRTVYKLARSGRLKTRNVHGALHVHLGSLINYRSTAGQFRRRLIALDGWLLNLPEEKLEDLSYRNIAAMARMEFSWQISPYIIKRAFRRLKTRRLSGNH